MRLVDRADAAVGGGFRGIATSMYLPHAIAGRLSKTLRQTGKIDTQKEKYTKTRKLERVRLILATEICEQGRRVWFPLFGAR